MQRYTHYEESHLKNPLHTTQHNNSYVEFYGDVSSYRVCRYCSTFETAIFTPIKALESS